MYGCDAKVQSCADLNNVRQLDSSCDVWLGREPESREECQPFVLIPPGGPAWAGFFFSGGWGRRPRRGARAWRRRPSQFSRRKGCDFVCVRFAIRVQELGCAPGPGQLAAMRTLPKAALVAKTWAASAKDCYEPSIDRRDQALSVKPRSSVEALQEGRYPKVPVLLGVTERDGLGKAPR